MENTVKYLQNLTFSRLRKSRQIEIKAKGRPTPLLSIEESTKEPLKKYVLEFSMSLYETCEWLCGCEVRNALYCFPCLLYGGDVLWTVLGVRDLLLLSTKTKSHEHTARHLHNIMNLAFLGKVVDTAHVEKPASLPVAEHNEVVRKNRALLSLVVDSLKFCGKFNLPISNDEISTNPGVFLGLLNFALKIDFSLNAHMASEAVFREKFNTIKKELLVSILSICKNKIREEVRNVNYLAVMCYEGVDTRDNNQVAIIMRYVWHGKPVEKFWGFFNPDSLERVLLNDLHLLTGTFKEKLIAQTYDGIALMDVVKKGLPRIINESYCNAHLISCFACEPVVDIERAVCQNSSARAFFNSLSYLYSYFNKCPQRMATLERVAMSQVKPLPKVVLTRFKSKVINAVYELKDVLVISCQVLATSTLPDTGCGAANIERNLSDPRFQYWLNFFCKVMPHVNVQFSFYSQMLEPEAFQTSFSSFKVLVLKLRSESDVMQDKFPDIAVAVKEVCDIILLEFSERLNFTAHLHAQKLLCISNFSAMGKQFPYKELARVGNAYKMLDLCHLRTELQVLYTRTDFCKCKNLEGLLREIQDNHLQSTLPEIVKLTNILLTTPMIKNEPDQQLQTFSRIQSFLQCSLPEDGYAAMAMISIEQQMISEISDFNEQVINNFAIRSRWSEFTYK